MVELEERIMNLTKKQKVTSDLKRGRRPTKIALKQKNSSVLVFRVRFTWK